MDVVDLKYFKMVVGVLAKEGVNDCAVNCVSCGDRKKRLHLYQNEGMDFALVHCYNSGCVFDDNQMGMVNFLKVAKPELVPQYKKEKFKDNIDRLKDDSDLNDILNIVTGKHSEPEAKKDIVVETGLELSGKEEHKGVKDTLDELEVKIPDLNIDTGLVLSNPKPVSHTRTIPPMIKKLFLNAKDVPECVRYIKDRGLDVDDEWLFSRERFVNIFDKSYFVENFLLIPLYQRNHLRGFYTRSIVEKRFSTIIFPKGEKYWVSREYDPDTPVYIFEGIMDALSSGFDNTSAMLSADLPVEVLEEIKVPIFCFDNDETGTKKALKYNKMGFSTFVWPNRPEKDLNQILQEGGSRDQNKNMITENIFSGLAGQVRLNLGKF